MKTSLMEIFLKHKTRGNLGHGNREEPTRVVGYFKKSI